MYDRVMYRFVLLLITSFALTSQAFAAVKWTNTPAQSNNPSTKNNINVGWIPEIKTELHDLDISNAKFKFIDEQLEKSLALFPEDEFQFWGANISGTDPGVNHSTPTRTVDCELVLKTMQPVGGEHWEAPLYIQNCKYFYQQNLFNGGLSSFQKVLDYWAEQGADNYPLNRGPDNDGNLNYAKRVAVASLTTIYSLFYEQFNNQEKINKFLSDWLISNQTVVRPNAKRCPVEFPPLYRKDKHKYFIDSCGSNNWRTSIAAIAFGLRTQNKDVYIAGVKQFEINISMYDEQGIFVPYASRGWDAPGYGVDNDEYISALAILFNDINFDLYQLRVKNRQTVGELTRGHTNWLENPSIAEKYILGTLTCNGGVCERFTSFAQAGSLAQWKIDKQFEAHDIQLRQLYYLYKHKGLSPLDIEEIANNFPYGRTLPQMYIWGQTSSFPTVFITLNQAGRLESYLKKSLQGNKAFSSSEGKSLRLESLQSKMDKIQPYEVSMVCDFQITRTLKDNGENDVIMRSRAFIEKGDLKLKDIKWETGINANWEDIPFEQDLVIAKDGKLVGVIPVYTMYGNNRWDVFELGNNFEKYGDPTTPQGINKSEIEDVQLEFELMDCVK